MSYFVFVKLNLPPILKSSTLHVQYFIHISQKNKLKSTEIITF